ncbi:MAG: SLC13 family permease [Verrucomicrobium sp.]
MNADLIWVLTLLSACVVLFVVNKPRMDVVALLALVLLPLTGVITVPEALAGFSDSSVLLIAALFVIGEGLSRTGVTYQVGEWLVRTANNNETRLMVLLMLAVSGLGAVMSSTGVVAMFIPVVLSVSNRLRVPPGRLMMPLSFAGLISGMITLVATPPNMVLDSALKHAGGAGFSFFSFTPIGLVILAMGIGYMKLTVSWLGGGKETSQAEKRRGRGLANFIEDYRLRQSGGRLRVLPGSPLDGLRLKDLALRRKHAANVVAVERRGRFRQEILNPTAEMVLHAGDVLLVHFSTSNTSADMQEALRLESLPLDSQHAMIRYREVGMVEAMVPPDSSLIGKTILEAAFRRRHGLNVVGLRRKGVALEGAVLEEKIKIGDILLVAGPWSSIRRLKGQTHDFVVLSPPADAVDVAPAMSQAPFALLCLAVMVILMVSGLVPNVLAALIACLMMGFFRCVDMDSAYKSIHWQSLVLIAGMMPFSIALERTGGVELAVRALMEATGGAGPRTLLASLFLLTSLISMFVSNTATAVLMAPIALSMASHLGYSPVPFAMTVAIAASSAFITPMSSPVNTLVLGPGQYRFGDFVKVGTPFTILVLLVTVLLVPWLFPLK